MMALMDGTSARVRGNLQPSADPIAFESQEKKAYDARCNLDVLV